MTITTKPDIAIACNAPACDTPSPTREELLKGGGLVGLGWHVAGGNTHFCPAHYPKDAK